MVSTAQDVAPLTAEELRETLVNLLEGLAAMDQVRIQDGYIQQLMELDVRQEELHQRELEVERQLKQIAERERDVEKQRGDSLQQVISTMTRSRSFGCTLKKVFTIGLARCA
jgi:hypothetical protein